MLLSSWKNHERSETSERSERSERSEMIFEHDSIKLLCVLNESMVREREGEGERERFKMCMYIQEWLADKLEEMIKDMSGKWKEEIDGSMMSRLRKHFSAHEQQVSY